MLLQPGTYAKLNLNRTIREIVAFPSAFEADATLVIPVTMTVQPAHNTATHRCTQNGWTVNANDVTPVWVVTAIPQEEIDAAVSSAAWRAADIRVRAVAAVATEEINLLRDWLANFKTQVAAASTLADLKTRVATLPNMPQRTLTQVRTAVANKIDAGTVD